MRLTHSIALQIATQAVSLGLFATVPKILHKLMLMVRTPSVLRLINHSPVTTTLNLIATISGTMPRSQDDAKAESAIRSTILLRLPGNDSSIPPVESKIGTPAIPETHPNLETAALSAVEETLTRVSHLDLTLAQRVDRLPVQPTTNDAVKGLASVLSSLDGVMKIADLLAEVKTLSLECCLQLTNIFMPQVHPFVKGVWSLVSAAYQVARMQAELDESIKSLIDTMAEACKLSTSFPAKLYENSDSIARAILKEVIKGASLIKIYCEKRPTSAYEMNRTRILSS